MRKIPFLRPRSLRSKLSTLVASALVVAGLPLSIVAVTSSHAGASTTGLISEGALPGVSTGINSLSVSGEALYAGSSNGFVSYALPLSSPTSSFVSSVGAGASITATSVDGSTEFVASADGTVEAISLGTTPTSLWSFNIGSAPTAILASGDGQSAWVLSASAGAVYQVTSTGVASTITTDPNPSAMVFANDDSELYVSSWTSNEVQLFDVASQTLISSFPCDAQPAAMVLSPSGDDLFVASETTGTLVDFSVTADNFGTAVNSSSLGYGVTALAMNPNGNDLVATSSSSNQVIEYATADLSMVRSAAVIDPTSVAYSADGTSLFVASLPFSGPPEIDMFQSGDTVDATPAMANTPDNSESLNDGAIWDGAMGSFIWLNPSTGAITNQIPYSGCITGQNFGATSTYLWVLDGCSGQMTEFLITTGAVLQNYTVQSPSPVCQPVVSVSGSFAGVVDQCYGWAMSFDSSGNQQVLQSNWCPQPGVAQVGSTTFITSCDQVYAYRNTGQQITQSQVVGCFTSPMAATATSVYVYDCRNQVLVFRASSLNYITSIPVPSYLNGMFIAGGTVFGESGSGGVVAISEAANTVGWTDNGGCYTSQATVTGNDVLWQDACSGSYYYVNDFSAPQYTIVYHDNGESGLVVPPTSPTGSSVTVAAPTGDVSNFSGWSTTSSGNGTFYQPGDVANVGSGNLDLYARPFAQVTYVATGPSGNDAPVDATNYAESSSATALSPTSDQAIFLDWNTAQDGSGTSYAVGSQIPMANGDITLYAQWQYTITQSGGLTNVSFNYSSTAPDTYVVPAGVYSMSLNMLGGEGGRGGRDASGRPVPGGFQGSVQGTIAVHPGEVLTIGIGGGGQDSPVADTCTGGVDNPGDPNDAVGGVNPLGGYGGGKGGSTGYQGCSGYGGSGGAASVVELGSSALTPSDLGVVVAGGSGGSGGSGQYPPNVGRISQSTFQASTDSSVPTNGSDGLSVYQLCHAPTASSCDGGGGAGGGGGAVGGDHGDVQFGSLTSNEWYGLGAFPGANDTANQAGLSASYVYYPDNNQNGVVTLSYINGLPSAPLNVNSVTSGTNVYVTWSTPVNTGTSPITDYVVRYSADGGSTWSQVDTHATSLVYELTGLSATTNYKIEVAAVNGSGQGDYSSLNLPPDAPTITNVDVYDGRLGIEFISGSGGNNTQESFQYSIDGGVTWHTSFSAQSPLAISGLTNGQQYSVEIRAITDAGVSPASNVGTGTPFGDPFYPDLSTVVTNIGSGQVDVSWAPANDNGSPITNYIVQAFDASTYGSQQSQCMTSTTECVLSGLNNGTTYYISIQSQNSAGYSLRSDPRIPVTPSADGVVFDANGGSSTISSIPYFSGGPAITLPTTGVTFPGYNFQGWALDQQGSNPVGATFTPSGVQTLYAMWMPGTYDVSFDANGGAGSVNDQFYTTGQTALSLPLNALSLTGYTFLGWGTTTSASSLLTPQQESSFAPTSDVTLHAIWQSDVVDQLNFDTQGGTAVAPVSGFDGTSVTLPSAPTQAGYAFAGWFTAASGGAPLTSPYTLSANQTIYAQWIPNSTDYIAFNTQTSSSIATMTGLDGTTITLPTPTVPSGYTFNGWFTAPTGGIQVSSPYLLNGSAVLFAQWTLPTYTVTYAVGAGSNAPSSLTGITAGATETLDSGSSVTPPTNKVFAGWDCGSGVVSSVTVNSDLTCNATYNNLYSITYAVGAGSNAPSSATGITPGSTVTLDTGSLVTPPTGATFAGWNCGSGVVTSVTVNSDLTCTANYNMPHTSQSETISYVGGSGIGRTGSAPARQTAPSGSTATVRFNPLGMTAPGYEFLGWSTSAAAKTPQFTLHHSSLVVPTHAVVLYAVWKPITTLASVYYAFGKWGTNVADYGHRIDVLAQLIKRGKYHHLTVYGAACPRGVLSWNIHIAQERAVVAIAAVKAALKILGDKAVSFKIVNQGVVNTSKVPLFNRHVIFEGFPNR